MIQQMPKPPHFFTTSTADKSVIFQHYGMQWKTVKWNMNDDTIVKIAENLNHFLVYFYIKQQKEQSNIYEEICEHITKTMNEITNEKHKIESNIDKNYNKKLTSMCERYGALDEYIIDKICMYIHDVVDENIEESKATTSITLRNCDVTVLTCMAVAIKFTYVYIGLFQENGTYRDTVQYYQDKLLRDICIAGANYFNYPDGDALSVHEYVDNFLHNCTASQWEKHDSGFREKFSTIGRDQDYHAEISKPTIIESLKKFGVRVKSEKLEREKYGIELSEDPSIKIYYRMDIDDWSDFSYPNMNMVKWIQTTVRHIIGQQYSPIKIHDTNSPDFLLDNTSDRSLKRENALYHDDMKHLYEFRKETSKVLFQQFLNEFKDFQGDLSSVRYFSIDKKHVLNYYVLRKSLICLTGEGKVYSEILGLYGKFILLLFYIRVQQREELAFMRPYISSMIGKMGVQEPCSVEAAQGFLEAKAGLGEKLEVSAEAFAYMVRIYTLPDGRVVQLGKEEVFRFFQFWEQPELVRNVFFPNIYSLEPENLERPIDPNIDEDLVGDMAKLAMGGVL